MAKSPTRSSSLAAPQTHPDVFGVPSSSTDLDISDHGDNTAQVLYIIASQPRSGSHMLGQALHLDGRFGNPLEYFHATHWKNWAQRCQTEDPEEIFLNMVRYRTSPTGIFGTKAHWPQFAAVQDTALQTYFDNARFIYLRRQDILAQAISWEIASQTGSWVSTMSSQKKPRFNRQGILNRIEEVLQQRQNWERFFAIHNPPVLEITYEDLLGYPARELNKISRFLGEDAQYTRKNPPKFSTDRQKTPRNARWKKLFLSEQSPTSE